MVVTVTFYTLRHQKPKYIEISYISHATEINGWIMKTCDSFIYYKIHAMLLCGGKALHPFENDDVNGFWPTN